MMEKGYRSVWSITVTEEKRGIRCRRRDAGVVSELDRRQLFVPLGLITSSAATKQLTNYADSSFRLSVGLLMISGRESKRRL